MRPDEFWELNDRYRDQKFYTAFCILASACSDYAVGVSLQRQNKLNWACTVLYYSLVHGARLACFVETGDFPRGHTQLSDLFSNGELRLSTRTNTTNTWIGKKLQSYVREQGTHVEPITEFRLEGLSLETRRHWGQILTKARKIREEAN